VVCRESEPCRRLSMTEGVDSSTWLLQIGASHAARPRLAASLRMIPSAGSGDFSAKIRLNRGCLKERQQDASGRGQRPFVARDPRRVARTIPAIGAVRFIQLQQRGPNHLNSQLSSCCLSLERPNNSHTIQRELGWVAR
jgi:hypothetical protein